MKVNLCGGYEIKGDALNYELTNGKTSYFYRFLNEAIDRFLELCRKEKLSDFDGNIAELLKEIKSTNVALSAEVFTAINLKGGFTNE